MLSAVGRVVLASTVVLMGSCSPPAAEPKATFASVVAEMEAYQGALKSHEQTLYDACIAPSRWADYEREAGDDVRRCTAAVALDMAAKCEKRTLIDYRNGLREDLGGRYGEAIAKECSEASWKATEALVAEWRKATAG